MRLTIFALFVTTGAAALCQSAPPAPAIPNPQSLAAPQWAQPLHDFSAQPRDWHFNTDSPNTTIILQVPAPLQKQNATQIDPKIVVHPPQSSLGEQSPAVQIAQNLYPGLTLMPINDSKAKLQQIPITFENLKVRNIPTSWPKFEFKSVENGATTDPARK
jgi:hypothetical protein